MAQTQPVNLQGGDTGVEAEEGKECQDLVAFAHDLGEVKKEQALQTDHHAQDDAQLQGA